MADDAQAACVPSGTTVTCTGDESGGISFTSPDVEILNVNSLTNDITPAGGVAGVSLIGQGGEGESHGSDPVKGKDGGTGGTGHSVEINYVGGVQVISTTGDSAQGIIGKSAGGKGGNGGEGIGAIGVPGVGGTGGAGGESEGVTIDASGNISTADSYGHGILAVSQGGDGGKGGFGSGAAIAEGFGGDGGHGGSAGVASVTNSGDIETAGTGAQGIFVQSLGGAGGAGGGANGISASAGSAGDSRVGSTVQVDNSGSIITGGSDAYGILAQSVGGFGGTGGGGSGIFAFGGGGSPGADGGMVTVDNSGPITTSGPTGYGILAQSVGGDGGKADSSGGLVTVGGDGAGGGDGAHVTLTNTGVINTGSTVSLGILAQSVGGGGGDAGSSGGLVTIGGSGDTGGNGGSVTGSNSGDITTAEKGSIGLLVQSVGGGGGHGGGSGALIAIGGSGGGGGAGNKVTFTNTGDVSTSGDQADAIFVQSQGGGGGHGGAALGLGAGLSIAVGGSAGGGNAGGDVDFNPNTDATSAPVTISTTGDQSVGVGVLSVGGGGGKGGWAISASAGPYDVSVGVGGKGGSGGVGGNVTANFNGTIGTAGNSSGGLIASSHGGGGGHGGFTVDVAGGQTGSISVGVGGSGGSGGDGGTVDLKSWAAITTGGDHSPGITAQSHGGGGGHGGFSVSVAAAGVAALGVSVGGKGGVGGNASTVDVASTGNIQTGGVQSYGLLAQSLGGGGGNGGFSVGVAGSAALSSSVSVGGAGEAGGNGGAVTASSDGTIVTTGDHADGLLAQSLGGSGGNGGFSVSASVSMAATIPVSVGGSADNGGTGDTVTVGNTGNITTTGSSANALHAQSLGGGGGSGGFSVAGGISIDPDPEGGSTANITVSVGGKGGNGNSASTVVVDNTGNLTTSGAGAVGLLATSQGGGGGNGGFSVAGSIAVSADGGANINVTVGGGGGTGNVGSDVTVNTTGNVQTSGDNATGIFAQSVGGSGGRGGFSVSGEISGGSEGYNIGVSVGGGGGSGNNAATVSLDSDGNVQTAGENSAAILAQSVGGGGGHGGFSVTAGIVAGSEGGNIGVGVGGKGSGGGDGGDVKVGQIDPNTGDVIGPITGNLTTTGNNSPGIQAQSIGGGGGSGGFSGTFGAGPQSEISVSVGGSGGSSGDGKDVTVNNGGDVTTTGKTSYGIQAQSVARGGGNGGFSIAGDLSISSADGTNADVSVSVGGSGGSGGTSGNVMLTNSGAVLTSGDGAHALYGQSVGGGGGNGGFSGSVNLAFNGDVNIGVSVGGGAGDGGTAGNVTVASTSATNITTLGDGASGIFAQSLGGKGGDGGFSFVANVGVGNSENGQDVNIGVSVGGGGGGGGTAGTVNVTNFSDISIGALETDTILNKTVITGVSGTSGSGVFAQSVGGNGGNGGLSVSGALDLSTSNPSNNLNVSVGGAGGSGNNANTVSVENHGDIATLGGKSNAIFAQSVGGHGGNGGLSFAGSLAGGAGSKDINVSIGGSGGGGGHGDTVTVVNTGALTTGTSVEFEPIGGITADIDEPVLLQGSPIPGYQAQAIFAQSVGGGGGTGGLAGSAVLSQTGKGTNLNVNVSVGGSGGAASKGGMVGVTNSGAITTYAVSAIGIVAQSVGGGGGAGGSSFTGIVGVTKPGSSDEEGRQLNINVAVGGKGGGGGDGGSVEVHNMAGGDITTFGGSAKGIAAQSIGGGGGSGGDADAFSMQIGKCGICSKPDELEKSFTLDVAVGGSGGAGGDASSVMVENFGIIQTAGASSEAIYAQSIGGGGGQGGNGALGLHDLIGIPGAVIDDLVDIVDPPIQFWTEAAVNVGGAGGVAGNGGEITIENNAALITTGDQSSAIYVQSGGGGGGQGGKSNGGALQIASVHVGGASGAAGDGSTVKVTNTGDIGTTGVSSVGIFAQSYGGGGGDGGAVNPDFLGTGWSFGLGIDVSQGGGHGGNGGMVTVKNTAVIVTEGEGAHGIWAQSVGGGGGLAGASGTTLLGSFAGSNGDDGDGDDVMVTHEGDILTLGDGAAGIFAQSASGGADGDSAETTEDGDDYAVGATGEGGNVTVNVNSTIITEGEKSRGIVAQSIGKNGNGDITVSIGTGSLVIGGTDMDGFGDNAPVGIQLLDGKTNLIKVGELALVATREGFSGTAISTSRTSNDMTTGNTTAINNTLQNEGIVTGSMIFAAPQFGGSNTVNNEITGLLNMGVTIDLGGSPNTLTNKGVVSPGGVNNILTTELNGDYVQDGLGSYVVTVDYADNNPAPEMYDGPGTNESDLINVTGNADLDGFVIVDAINGAFVGPDQSGSVLILESAGGFDNPTLIANDTEVVNYEITYDNTPSGNKVFLDWIVDFTPDGLNRNETAVANYIIEAIDIGDPLAISPVINSLLEAKTLDELRNDYDRLTPEPYIDNEISTVLSNMRLGRSLMDCRSPNEDYDDHKGCLWLRGGAMQAEQTETFEYLGFDEFAYEAQAGIGGNLSETVGAVVGFSYSNSQIDTKGRFGTPDVASSTGQRYQGGVGLSKTVNGSTFSIAALGGAAFYDVERNLELTDFSATADGEQNIYFGGGQIRLAHEAQAGVFRFAPLFEAWGGYFYQDEISESGAAGASLDIESKEDYFLAVRPALTLALEFTSDEGAVFRPFLTGGATYFAVGNEGDGPSLTATMQGEENEVPGFTVSSALQEYYVDAAAGFVMKSPGGAALRFSGSAQYAEEYLSYGGDAKFVMPF